MIDPKSLRIGNTLIKEMEEAIQRCPMTQSQASSCASVAMKWMGEFRDWYDKLSPAEKCTVWPPAGSGSGTGLYNMQTEDIVDKFLSYKKKLATPTEPDTKGR